MNGHMSLKGTLNQGMKASVLRHRKLGKEDAAPHTEPEHERDKEASIMTLPKDCCINCSMLPTCGMVCPKVDSKTKRLIEACDQKGEYCEDYHGNWRK